MAFWNGWPNIGYTFLLAVIDTFAKYDWVITYYWHKNIIRMFIHITLSSLRTPFSIASIDTTGLVLSKGKNSKVYPDKKIVRHKRKLIGSTEDESGQVDFFRMIVALVFSEIGYFCMDGEMFIRNSWIPMYIHCSKWKDFNELVITVMMKMMRLVEA